MLKSTGLDICATIEYTLGFLNAKLVNLENSKLSGLWELSKRTISSRFNRHRLRETITFI